MVGPRIYHVHQTRSYTGLNQATALEAMNGWLRSSDFKVRRKSNKYSKGSKHGVHVNFVPKFKLYVETLSDGSTIVKFDYYGKMKVGTLVVVGILTSGISTAVGVATYAMRLMEADQVAASFWSFVDTLSRGTVTVIKTERWGHDKHGHYCQQPAIAVTGAPVAVVAQPVVQPVVVANPQQYAAQPYAVGQPYGVAQPYPPYAHPFPQQVAYTGQPQYIPPQTATREVSTTKTNDYPGNYSSTTTTKVTSNAQYGNYNPSQPQVYGHQQPTSFPQQSAYPQHPQSQYQPAQYHPQQQQFQHQSSQPLLQVNDMLPQQQAQQAQQAQHPQMYYPNLEQQPASGYPYPQPPTSH